MLSEDEDLCECKHLNHSQHISSRCTNPADVYWEEMNIELCVQCDFFEVIGRTYHELSDKDHNRLALEAELAYLEKLSRRRISKRNEKHHAHL